MMVLQYWTIFPENIPVIFSLLVCEYGGLLIGVSLDGVAPWILTGRMCHHGFHRSFECAQHMMCSVSANCMSGLFSKRRPEQCK